MGGHFRAFSFVDRILDVEHGLQARGRYAVPAGLAGFPTSLVAEAVGQLAAWMGMAATEFRRRPVAGLAGRIEILSQARPGQTLDLAVELDHVDTEAIAYRGVANADGVAILRLDECVGPMLAAEEFDDPLALRERFGLLCGPGAPPGSFSGLDMLSLHTAEVQPGGRWRATLQVPAAASFFDDHFPRRPVLPGTLLLDAMLRLASTMAQNVGSGDRRITWAPRKASGVKLRAFIAPGETVDLEAAVQEQDSDHLGLRLGARAGQRSVASARVELTAGSAG
jgi:3-hydroxymyristoyl/3-hydroxydecanoyl-(acyl carrier protein) dehydratase